MALLLDWFEVYNENTTQGLQMLSPREFIRLLESLVCLNQRGLLQVKNVFCQPDKAYNARLGKGSEAFNVIDI